MDDPERVRLADRLAGLEHELDRLLDGERAPLLEPRGQIAAVEVLHHHVRRAALELADVADARDVLALDLHRRPRLALEAPHRLGVGEHLGQEKLQRDLLVELEVMRLHDDPHAADAEHLVDTVLSGENLPFVYRRGHDGERYARRAALDKSQGQGSAPDLSPNGVAW